MNLLYRHFLTRILWVSLVLVISGALVFGLWLPQYYLPALPLLLLFVVLFTWITFTWLVKASEKGIGKFTRTSMMITMLRLVVYGALAVIWLLLFRQKVWSFVISLGLLYLIYTFLEISEVTQILQNKSKKDQTDH